MLRRKTNQEKGNRSILGRVRYCFFIRVYLGIALLNKGSSRKSFLMTTMTGTENWVTAKSCAEAMLEIRKCTVDMNLEWLRTAKAIPSRQLDTSSKEQWLVSEINNRKRALNSRKIHSLFDLQQDNWDQNQNVFTGLKRESLGILPQM